MNMEKFIYVHIVDGNQDMLLNEEQELLSLIKDNNRMIKDIWTILNNPNNDIKDFVMNVIANQFGRR